MEEEDLNKHMAEANDFLNSQGQTSPTPYLVEVDRAEGIYIYDKSNKAYMDMIAGVAVNNIGHGHPKVVSALKKQIDKHLHVNWKYDSIYVDQTAHWSN